MVLGLEQEKALYVLAAKMRQCGWSTVEVRKCGTAGEPSILSRLSKTEGFPRAIDFQS